jgi:HTH-type transcriptional regulator/antitoxin HigA
MDIRPIKTNEDYEMVLSRINELMDARRGTAQGDELDILATLVDAYESQRFPIKAPDPVAAILFRMEQMGYNRRDLEPFIGTRARVSEVLNRKRNLSIRQIRQLHAGLNIPLESLIGHD